jgi:hypothetical protein
MRRTDSPLPGIRRLVARLSFDVGGRACSGSLRRSVRSAKQTLERVAHHNGNIFGLECRPLSARLPRE